MCVPKIYCPYRQLCSGTLPVLCQTGGDTLSTGGAGPEGGDIYCTVAKGEQLGRRMCLVGYAGPLLILACAM